MLRNAFEMYGLDYSANSEHGGRHANVPTGLTSCVAPVWRWMTLTDSSFPIILDARAIHPEKEIIQGYE